MSALFSTPPPPASPASASKPVDVSTLQIAFAEALRNGTVSTGGTQTNTMLELLSPADHAQDKQQQRREQPQQTRQTDFVDRKLLDKSEVRQSEIQADYQTRMDRHETIRTNYHEKVERRELQQPVLPASSPRAIAPNNLPLDSPQPTELPPHRNDVIVSETAHVSHLPQATAGVAAPNSPAIHTAAGLALPMQTNVPLTLPSATSQATPPQTFTIFTASGRFGHAQEKSDDQEEEKEEKDESTDEKPVKNKTPLALFEAIHMEITRPIKRGPLRQEPQTTDGQPAETPREKPKESDSPQSEQVVRSLEELLNTPQQVLVPKKAESPQKDYTHYLKRVADACEAASHFAPIRIKINLDHLGTLTLRFFYQSDRLTLRFETPTRETAHFLREHLDGFKAILSERNVKLASAEVWLDENRPINT